MLEIKQQKLSRNSNGHDFSLRCPIRRYNISRRLKLNNGSCRQIRLVITFHTNKIEKLKEMIADSFEYSRSSDVCSTITGERIQLNDLLK